MTTVEDPPPPPADEAKTAHVIRRTDGSGDTRLEWDPEKEAEVAAAREFFDSLVKKKYLAYSVDANGDKAEVLKEFDPNATEIIMSPQLVGG